MGGHLCRSLVLDPKVKLKYQQLITNSFVEVSFVIYYLCEWRVWRERHLVMFQCNKLLRWCPQPDCGHVIKVHYYASERVTCKCGNSIWWEQTVPITSSYPHDMSSINWSSLTWFVLFLVSRAVRTGMIRSSVSGCGSGSGSATTTARRPTGSPPTQKCVTPSCFQCK